MHPFRHLLLLALFLITNAYGAGDYQTISNAALSERLQEPALLVLDVRSPKEYAEGHVPGALNIPHGEIMQRLEQLRGHEQGPVVIYCESGRRAAMALDALAGQGFSQLLHLDGDMQGWRANALPQEK